MSYEKKIEFYKNEISDSFNIIADYNLKIRNSFELEEIRIFKKIIANNEAIIKLCYENIATCEYIIRGLNN